MSYIPTNSNYSKNSIYTYPSSSTNLGVLSYNTKIYTIYFSSLFRVCIDVIVDNNSPVNILNGAGDNYSINGGYGITQDGSYICIFSNNGSVTQTIIFSTSTYSVAIATSSTPKRILGTVSLSLNSGTITFYAMGLTPSTSDYYAMTGSFPVTGTASFTLNSYSMPSVNVSGCIALTLNGVSDIICLTGELTLNGFYLYNFTTQKKSALIGGAVVPYEIYSAYDSVSTNTYIYAVEYIGSSVNFTTYTVTSFAIDGSGVPSATFTSQGQFPALGYGIYSVGYSMSFSKTGGTNLQRYYLISGGVNRTIDKLYATSGGASTGGDPKVVSISGKEVTITPEDPFLYLDTHPFLGNFFSNERVYIWCDSFNVGDHPELMSEYQHIHVNNKESFIKNFYILTKNRKIIIDMTNLEVTLFSEENPFGEESNVEIVLSSKKDCTNIPLSEYPVIKNKGFREDLIFFKQIKISSIEYSLAFELIRTKCINYSDIYISLEGKRDLSTYDGVIISGDVNPPLFSIPRE